MDVDRAVEELYRTEWGRWKSGSIPQNPRAWLIQTARHKALDRLRREARLQEKLGELGGELDESPSS